MLECEPFVGIVISIHALHEESDAETPHARTVNRIISIHALHEESDSHLRAGKN